MADQTTVNGGFVDLYEILEVSPFAARLEIKKAVGRKMRDISDPDSNLSLSDRTRLHPLVKLASATLTKTFKARVQYDIRRMMVRRELALDQIPAPSRDYPSTFVATIRFQRVRRSLEKAFNALVTAYDDAEDQQWIQERIHGDRCENLDKSLGQMKEFCAHLMLDMRKATRGTRVILNMGEDAWGWGLRDPRVDMETGEPNLARRTLGELQVLEEQVRRCFWVQIARALAKVDPSARPRDGREYCEQLLDILGHLRRRVGLVVKYGLEAGAGMA